MQYDVSFQLIEPNAVRTVLESLVRGEKPAPSKFDERADAADMWATAQQMVLQAESEAAARAVGQLVAMWSASTLPSVRIANFGVTSHPPKMADELRDVPHQEFTSPELALFFPILTNRRPDLHFSGVLDDNFSIGGYVSSPRRAGRRLRLWYRSLPPSAQQQALPLLKIIRAAERHGYGVLESAGLLGSRCPEEAMLHWPGMNRFGLEGEPLSVDEWRALRRMGVSTSGDMADVSDRIVEVCPTDVSRRDLVLHILRDHNLDNPSHLIEVLPDIVQWLQTVLWYDEAAWPLYRRYRQELHDANAGLQSGVIALEQERRRAKG